MFPRRYRKILLGDLNAKFGSGDIFKTIIGNESLHKAINDKEIRVVNFATSKNLIVESTFPHRNVHKDHALTDKRRQSNILDIRSFRGANSDTDHYVIFAKLRERISVIKRARQNFDLEGFDLKKLDDVEVKEKYQIEISNRFVAL
jgi:endonuclease/exonuclease/phosphatase family metal-dependent hydrolase